MTIYLQCEAMLVRQILLLLWILVSQLFQNQMLNKTASLFSLDLRIENEITKLKVYEEDTITDLVNRLFGSLSLKSSSKDKLKSKLEEQFRKIIHKKQLSQIIKNKLDSLLDESKIVIMDIQTEKNEVSINETPFRILQESVLNGKKASLGKAKKNFHYLDEDSTILNVKYQPRENNQNSRPYVTYGDSKFENVILKSKNVSPQKLTHQNIRQADKSQQVLRRLDEDRKWQNLAHKNANSNQNYYQQGVQPQLFRYQANKIDKVLQQKLGYKGIISKNDYKTKQIHEKRFQRSNSAKITQFQDQPYNNETFLQYKMNRYKSNSNNFISQQLHNQQLYRTTSNREQFRPSKSTARLNYAGQNILHTIMNYDTTNICATIRNYDSHLSTKCLGGAVSYKNLKGKFNYLGNE